MESKAAWLIFAFFVVAAFFAVGAGLGAWKVSTRPMDKPATAQLPAWFVDSFEDTTTGIAVSVGAKVIDTPGHYPSFSVLSKRTPLGLFALNLLGDAAGLV